MPDPKSVTLHDVARVAGVSLITASRALSRPEVVSPQTIARVQQAVELTGYLPNLLAGGLKSRRSLTVALLVPVVSVPQFLPTVQSLTEAFDRAGYQVILGQTGYDRGRERALLATMASRRVDGIVVAGLLARDAQLDRLRRIGIPIVETWDFTDQPVDMVVGFSHRAVGEAVAGFFRAQGWQRVGVASADDERARQRMAGFVAAWGGPVSTTLVPAPSTVRSGRESLARLLEQEPGLQAVHCSSDNLAHGVLLEAQARGLDVPRRLSVCGFGDAPMAAALEPALTTVQVDAERIGREAARMVLARCRGQVVERPVIDIGFGIVQRASTPPPV